MARKDKRKGKMAEQAHDEGHLPRIGHTPWAIALLCMVLSPSVDAAPVLYLQAPVHGMPVTSPFSMRLHPIYHRWMPHKGVDFGAPIGTTVYAANQGMAVQHSQGRAGWGNYLTVTDGATGVQTLYAHLSRFAVATGSQVRAGQMIGYTGSSGGSTGPHLHLELRINGQLTDPLLYISAPGAEQYERIGVERDKEYVHLTGQALAPYYQQSVDAAGGIPPPAMDSTQEPQPEKTGGGFSFSQKSRGVSAITMLIMIVILLMAIIIAGVPLFIKLLISATTAASRTLVNQIRQAGSSMANK